MKDDWTYLQKKLDRLDGNRMTFGSFKGWRVEAIPRDYLLWCLEAVPLRHELRRTIRRVLAGTAPHRRAGRTGPAVPVLG